MKYLAIRKSYDSVNVCRNGMLIANELSKKILIKYSSHIYFITLKRILFLRHSCLLSLEMILL